MLIGISARDANVWDMPFWVANEGDEDNGV